MLAIQAVKHLEIEDTVFAQQFNLATILFADIVDYTVIASSLSPIQVVALLDELYTIFDKLVKKHGVYKGYFTRYSISSFKFS
jgi:class 3 adenylate cyclase